MKSNGQLPVRDLYQFSENEDAHMNWNPPGNTADSLKIWGKGLEDRDPIVKWSEISRPAEKSWTTVMLQSSCYEQSTVRGYESQYNAEISGTNWISALQHHSRPEHSVAVLLGTADFLQNLARYPYNYSWRQSLKRLYSFSAIRWLDFHQQTEQEMSSAKVLHPAIPWKGTTASQHPWQMEKSKVEIIEEYDAQIVDDEGEDYAIEFFDYDGSVVEASLPKKDFKILPHSVKTGTHFWIVVYRLKDRSGTALTVWPVKGFWDKSWLDG